MRDYSFLIGASAFIKASGVAVTISGVQVYYGKKGVDLRLAIKEYRTLNIRQWYREEEITF